MKEVNIHFEFFNPIYIQYLAILGFFILLSILSTIFIKKKNSFLQIIKKLIYLGLVISIYTILSIVFSYFRFSPAIALKPEGIICNKEKMLYPKAIAWEDILEFEARGDQSHYGGLIIIKVSNPQKYIDNVTGISKTYLTQNNDHLGTPITIPCTFLKKNAKEITELMSAYKKSLEK